MGTSLSQNSIEEPVELLNHERAFLSTLLAFAKENIGATIGLLIIMSWAILGILAPLIVKIDPYELSYDILVAPSLSHPFGTDQFGRDVLSQVIYGTRVSLVFGLGVSGLSVVIGIFLGMIPGYFGGWLDLFLSRLTEIALTMPVLLITIIGVAVFGNTIWVAIIAIALFLWPANARIMRAEVLAVKTQEYVLASLSYGTGHLRLLYKHILPNAIPPVITSAALQMAYAIIIEAGLSFIGLGDPNNISWGQIIFRGQTTRYSWWLTVFPGVAIWSFVLGTKMVSDGINQFMDPLREQIRRY